MDYNQQVEAMRLDAPERLGVERLHRVDVAVENVLRATFDAAEKPNAEMVGRNATAAVLAEAERVVNDAAVLAEAESIVEAESQRIESHRQEAVVNDAISQARAEVDAYAGNPLIQG